VPAGANEQTQQASGKSIFHDGKENKIERLAPNKKPAGSLCAGRSFPHSDFQVKPMSSTFLIGCVLFFSDQLMEQIC
jgi:hypothetical protein